MRNMLFGCSLLIILPSNGIALVPSQGRVPPRVVAAVPRAWDEEDIHGGLLHPDAGPTLARRATPVHGGECRDPIARPLSSHSETRFWVACNFLPHRCEFLSTSIVHGSTNAPAILLL